MAEYIDRTELEPDTEWSEYEDGFISYSQSQINSLPKADVIEKEKLDKAIEEIIKYRDDATNDFCEVEVGAINGVLEILKRNIGE